MAELIEAKLLALFVGLVICAVGALLLRFGGEPIRALNRMYDRLPLRFQYPPWWHRFMGWMFIGFGVLFAVTGVALARTLPR